LSVQGAIAGRCNRTDACRCDGAFACRCKHLARRCEERCRRSALRHRCGSVQRDARRYWITRDVRLGGRVSRGARPFEACPSSGRVKAGGGSRESSEGPSVERRPVAIRVLSGVPRASRLRRYGAVAPSRCARRRKRDTRRGLRSRAIARSGSAVRRFGCATATHAPTSSVPCTDKR
jgi:hypothetical protein